VGTQDIVNYLKVNDELITAGQPTVEQLRAAASEGVTVVINLATLNPRYALADEAGLVESLGVAYFHIPVPWENPTENDFKAFEAAMDQRPPGKTLLHCAANFRATAFYALYALKHLGWSEQQAEAFREPIWKGSHEPVWERFIAEMKARPLKPGSES
jgi:protein tyrosine phosphatase (PTP) superfamily phosphohydrolase (DUF442 family)